MARPSASTRGILNPRAGAERFRLERYAPSDDLDYFVERYWTVTWDLRGQEPYVQETLPHPCVNLAVEPGRSAVHGVATRRSGAHLEGQGYVFGVKFRPGGFHPFVGVPVADFTDRVVPLEEVFGADASALEPSVLGAADDTARIAIVEAFLRVRMPEPDPVVASVVEIARVALEDREITRVEHLTKRVEMSPRSLQRLFRRYVGVSPKWMIRCYRLHEAAERVAHGSAIDWTALAQELGYFDQPHFIRDFKQLVGRSPREYAAACAAAASG